MAIRRSKLKFTAFMVDEHRISAGTIRNIPLLLLEVVLVIQIDWIAVRLASLRMTRHGYRGCQAKQNKR